MKIFIVAGEHSGDALGGKLIAALKRLHAGSLTFAGVGGEDMAREGFVSLFPIEDVAVMGPMSILPRLPRILRRVYQTVDAAVRSRSAFASARRIFRSSITSVRASGRGGQGVPSGCAAMSIMFLRCYRSSPRRIAVSAGRRAPTLAIR
jgi:hypothetical protein